MSIANQPLRFLVQTLLVACVLALVTACHDDGGDVPTDGGLSLSIYVYAPDSPILTRTDIGNVDATADELSIRRLQIWIFEHSDTHSGALVGYLDPAVDQLNIDRQDVYQMLVTDVFAARRPHVDVYLLAGITPTNCGLSFDAATSQATLEDALLGNGGSPATDYYGLTRLVTSTSETDGLPMAGVLRDQPVFGQAPVLRIGTSDRIATVRLERIISKLQFFFSQQKESGSEIQITGITMGDDCLPTHEYLFTDGLPYHTTDAYEAATPLFSDVLADVATTDDVSKYIYRSGQDADQYATLLQAGLAQTPEKDAELMRVGPFYLRESDRRLHGTIDYTIDGSPRQADFAMSTAGDFARNHTWVVYCYYIGGDRLGVQSVYVKDWTIVNAPEHEIYNW